MGSDIDLPEEILIQILVKLPVKSLVRFRCVSKSWDALITNQSFVSLHLQHAMANHDRSVVLLRHFSPTQGKDHNTLFLDGEDFLEHQELELPFVDAYSLTGDCNGLICFSDYIIKDQVILWNPSLRKCVQLPIPRFIDTDDLTHMYVLGFGFDKRSLDYRVVRLIYILGEDFSAIVPPEVEVYELKTNAWRGIQNFSAVPYVIPEYSPQAFVNGAIHWIGYNPDDKVASYPRSIVVLFDMHDEVFGEMELPKGTNYADRLNLSLAVHQDLICLFHCHPTEEDGRQLYRVCWVWVMKEYGVSDSWAKLFTINIGEHGGIGRVLGFRKHGSVLLVTHDCELVSYDSRSQRLSRLGLYGAGRSFKVIAHMDCLVLM